MLLDILVRQEYDDNMRALSRPSAHYTRPSAKRYTEKEMQVALTKALLEMLRIVDSNIQALRERASILQKDKEKRGVL